MSTEFVNWPDSYTEEAKDVARELTWMQDEINAHGVFMTTNGCVPNPTNCGACNNTGCSTVFRIEMNANVQDPPTPEYG